MGKETGDKKGGTSSKRRRSKKRSWLVDAAIVLVVFLGVRAYQTRDAVRGPLPEIQARMLDGTPVDMAAYRGAPLLLHFWATWCHTCRATEHNIVALAEDLPVLTVASRSGPPERVQEYLSEGGVQLPVAVDMSGALAQHLGVRAYPTSFILDAEGNVQSVEVGFSSELGLRARMWWAGL